MTREEAIKILVRAQRGLIATALSEYEHKIDWEGVQDEVN